MKMDKKARYRRIWNCVASIPRGRVASYGQVADLAGVHRGARLVGPALRAAPPGLCLAWHRVINARGRIAIQPDNPAHREQVRRLRAENVTVIDGRVDVAMYKWSPTLDEIVWGPMDFPDI
jgi:methylated-DNA-protein-cysteine methyltransferase-like protein